MKPAWAPDGLTLSARTTKGGKDITRQVAKEIAAAIRKGETVEKAALSLSDGYGYGHVLPAQDIPAFMQQLAAIGKRREYKGRAFRQVLRTIERQLERVNTQGLKSAYHALKDAIEAGNEKSIRKAIYVATQERTRYFARRIARTEMARAYGDGVMAKWADDDDCVAFQWRTSSAHPFGDICDLYGKADLYGMGKGIYPKDKVPRLPVHPNCMCHLRPVMAGSDLIKGKEKDNIEQGGMDYIRGLNLHQQERLLGENGRKEVLRKGNWRSKARGYSGEMMRSRVESEQSETRKKNNVTAGKNDVKMQERNVTMLVHPLRFKTDGIWQFIPRKTLVEEKRIIAGGDTNKVLRVADKLSVKYEVDKNGREKVVGVIVSDRFVFDVHWYRHPRVGDVEYKIKNKKERRKNEG